MDKPKWRPNAHLKRVRELRGWSQEDVAEKIGTTQKIVSRWERGESMPVPYYPATALQAVWQKRC